MSATLSEAAAERLRMCLREAGLADVEVHVWDEDPHDEGAITIDVVNTEAECRLIYKAWDLVIGQDISFEDYCAAHRGHK